MRLKVLHDIPKIISNKILNEYIIIKVNYSLCEAFVRFSFFEFF